MKDDKRILKDKGHFF
ncbi:MAG: hypothetical protein QG610_788, partial [Euryarchaeota archaeon]|nr:hypothetical protein [Euryarchaeota archaeon]